MGPLASVVAMASGTGNSAAAGLGTAGSWDWQSGQSAWTQALAHTQSSWGGGVCFLATIQLIIRYRVKLHGSACRSPFHEHRLHTVWPPVVQSVSFANNTMFLDSP